MAQIIEISNPCDPLRDTVTTQHPGGVTIREWLSERFGPSFVEFDRPTLCLLNGEPVMRRDWASRVIGAQDVVNFVSIPGLPLAAIMIYVIIAVAVVAAVALVLTMKLPQLAAQNSTMEGDPVYTLKGQKNQVRLNDPIEVGYGRVRMWPAYAALPYNRFIGNDQWSYQLFCLGQGSWSIESINIEDTPITSFANITTEVVQPGGQVTLFPDNVVTSVEVASIELLGTNEGGGGSTIVDSVGDSNLGIPQTSHATAATAGPFNVNPSGTLTTQLEFDVSLPRGLYATNAQTGAFVSQQVTAEFQARAIDDSGTPTGSWVTVATFSRTMTSATPQRFTLTASVASGRYQVRGYRTNAKNTDARAANELRWESVRAILPSTRNYGNVTILAVKAKATNNLNDNSASRINVVGTRIIPVWNGSSWADTPSRSIVWALCDIFRNTVYGGRVPDANLDLGSLLTLDGEYTARGEFFDWVFDQRATCLDAAQLVATVGRAVPIPIGSRMSMIRDEPKSLPTAIFTPENIVKDSFKWEIKMVEPGAPDGLVVTYKDATTWKDETVACYLPGDGGINPEKVTLYGCTSRQNAYQWGMWKRAMVRYNRGQISFRTGLEGHIPSYGDLIGVTHDLPRWGQGGLVLAISGNDLTLSEPVTFEAGQHQIMLRKKNGSVAGPVVCTSGVDAHHVVTASALNVSDFALGENTEPPIFTFGPSNFVTKYCKVLNLAPGDDDTVEVTCIPYRPEPYGYDAYTAPSLGNTSGTLTPLSSLPTVTNLLVSKYGGSSTDVVATWTVVNGAKYYRVQYSHDGAGWNTVNDALASSTIRFTVTPGKLYVRVAAMTTAFGPWANWVGDAPVDPSAFSPLGVLDNDNCTVPAASDGSNPILGPAVTTMQVFLGINDDSANWAFAATPSAGVTGTLVGRTWTTTGFTSDSGYVDIVATRASFGNVTCRFTLSKAKAGSSGSAGLTTALVYLFKRSVSVPTKPTTTSTYTFASAILTGHDGGWTQAVPANDGNSLYVITATASSTGASDTIATNEWSAPVVMVANGGAGVNGNNVCVVSIYKRSATAPAVPTTTSTFTFSTAVLTGHDNGWTQSVPTNDGNPLYVTTAAASSSTNSDTIATGEWSVPVILATNGTNGANGYNSAPVFIYRRFATQPPLPNASTVYTFSTGVLTGLTNSWTQSIPADDGKPVWVAVATASAVGSTDTLAAGEWATPVVLAQNGASAFTLVNDANCTVVGNSITKIPASNGWNEAAAHSVESFTGGAFCSFKVGRTMSTLVAGLNSDPTTNNDYSSIDYGWYATSAGDTQIYENGTPYYGFGAYDANTVFAITYDGKNVVYTMNGVVKRTVAASAGLKLHFDCSIWGGFEQILNIAFGPSGAAGNNGNDGVPGLNAASVYLYQRAATTPTLPSVNSTYTFATSALTGHNNGWAQSVPTNNGQKLWVTTATAASATATDVIAPGEWAAASVMAENGADSTAYWLISSASAIGKTQAGVFLPASVTFTGKSQTGIGSPGNYSGRFVIAESTDGTNFTDVYSSGANEASTSRTPSGSVKAIRVRLYQAGGFSTLLDEETVPVVSDGADSGNNGSVTGTISGGGSFQIQADYGWVNSPDITLTLDMPAGTYLITFEGMVTNASGETRSGEWGCFVGGSMDYPRSFSNLPSGANFAISMSRIYTSSGGVKTVVMAGHYQGGTTPASMVISGTLLIQ
jgi:hypothetical protein